MKLISIGHCPERIFLKAKERLVVPYTKHHWKNIKSLNKVKSCKLSRGFRLLYSGGGTALILNHANYTKKIKNYKEVK